MTQPMPYVKVDGDGFILAHLTAAAAGTHDLIAPQQALPAGYAWRWIASASKWVLVPDRRGQTYASPDGERAITISRLLDEPPEDWVLLDARGHAMFDGRREARAAVEAARDRWVFAPIEVDGQVFDADAPAQAAIAARRTDVEASVAMGLAIPPALLIWRDHNNVVHRFDTVEAFGGLLARLSLAISNRKTEAYAWSWEQKSRISAATAPDEIYDVLRAAKCDGTGGEGVPTG